MEPTNTVIQLEDNDGKPIGLYLTTRLDVKNFQNDFSSALKKAQGNSNNQEEELNGWKLRDYLDEELAKEYDLWRTYAEPVNLKMSKI